MGYFIIAAAMLGLFSYLFQLFWKAVLKFCYWLLKKSIDVIKKLITFVKRAGRAVAFLYRRYKNGKIVRTEYTEEEVHIEDLPEDLQKEFEDHDEVVVRNNTDIEPEEFE